MNEVSLLLHVVRDEDLGHQDLLSGLLLFFHLSLAATVHSLLGADVKSLALIFIVSLPLLEQGFLGDPIGKVSSITSDATYSKFSIILYV